MTNELKDCLDRCAAPDWLRAALTQLKLPLGFWIEFIHRFRTVPALDSEAWGKIDIMLRLALATRFESDPRKLPRIHSGAMADVVYFLPDEDGSPEFFAECLLRFIHEEADRAQTPRP